MNNFEKYTDKGVLEKAKLYETVPSFLDYIEKEYSDLDAVCSSNKNVTYKELSSDVKKVCKVLEENDIKVKTNVGIISDNNYNFVKASLGAMAYGGVATMLPVQLDEKTIFGCCMKYQLTCLLYEGAVEEKIALAKKMAPHVKFIKIEDVNGATGAYNYNIDKFACQYNSPKNLKIHTVFT